MSFSNIPGTSEGAGEDDLQASVPLNILSDETLAFLRRRRKILTLLFIVGLVFSLVSFSIAINPLFAGNSLLLLYLAVSSFFYRKAFKGKRWAIFLSIVAACACLSLCAFQLAVMFSADPFLGPFPLFFFFMVYLIPVIQAILALSTFALRPDIRRGWLIAK